jgi:hypothetical protein
LPTTTTTPSLLNPSGPHIISESLKIELPHHKVFELLQEMTSVFRLAVDEGPFLRVAFLRRDRAFLNLYS